MRDRNLSNSYGEASGWMTNNGGNGAEEALGDLHPEFREDLRYWVEVDRKVALRILDLVEAIMSDPFTGVGKPEPLKYLASGTWSRRITQEHRLVDLVSDQKIDFLQARYHY